MTIKTPIDWAKIAEDYRHCLDLTVSELCRRHGIPKSTLYRRIESEGWRLRRPPVAPAAQALGSPFAPGGKGASRQGLFFRLCRALEHKITEFEQSRRPSEELTPADKEREARTLHAMIRMFEKLSAMNSDASEKQEQGAEAKAKGHLSDADELRRQLAERLDRLRRARDTGTIPQKPEG